MNKEKNGISLLTIFSVVQCRKFSKKQNVDVSCSEFRWTNLHCGLYIFHLNDERKKHAFNDIFPELSRPRKIQDFPGGVGTLMHGHTALCENTQYNTIV